MSPNRSHLLEQSGSTPSLVSTSTPTPSLTSTHVATPAEPDVVDKDKGSDVEVEKICTDLHALYCFDVLVAHFEGREPISPPFGNAKDKYALFVTWNKTNSHRSNSKPSLRGCIGNFSPMVLSKGLKEYALVSALEDHRFSPMKSSELPSLSCNVSLLTPFEPISNPLEWTPGTHGIHITFPHPSHSHRTLSATYLPEVCPEQGWTREETIFSAIQKAGYRGKVEKGDSVWNSMKVKVYGSVKSGVTWNDYLTWKEGRDETVFVKT